MARLRLFISYSRNDRDFARRLATDLKQFDADLWMGLDDIPRGMNWNSAIQEGLNRADVMILIISPDSMQSKYVEDEWQYFLDKRRPIIPVLLSPTNINYQLKRLQYVDFYNEDYFHALQRLYKVLARDENAFVVPQSSVTSPSLILIILISLVVAITGLMAWLGIFPASDYQPTQTALVGYNQTQIAIVAYQTQIASIKTPSHTRTPTSLPATIAPTKLALTFDAMSTQLALTATAPAASGVSILVTKSFIVEDDAGVRIGEGEVRLYAPSTLMLGSSSEIMVQIEMKTSLAATQKVNPTASSTPLLETPRPSLTPLPLVDRQFTVIYEYMGAGLRGAQTENFLIDAIPPSGIRRMYSDTVNWWKWNISPKVEALGTNSLEVYIFLQRSRNDGTNLDTETNSMPFKIDVIDPRAAEKNVLDLSSTVISVAEAIAGVFGVFSAFYSLAKFITNRKKRKADSRQ